MDELNMTTSLMSMSLVLDEDDEFEQEQERPEQLTQCEIEDLLNSIESLSDKEIKLYGKELINCLIGKETELTKEKDVVYTLLHNLERSQESTNSMELISQQIESFEKQLEIEEKNVEKLRNNLKTVQKETKSFQLQFDQLNKQMEKLVKFEAEYQNDELIFVQQTQQIQIKQQSLERKIQRDTSALQILMKNTVLNRVFNIRLNNESKQLYINGFRFGIGTSKYPDWKNVNSAWGQVAFLLDTLAAKLGYEFKKYFIIPYGEFTKIAPTNSKTNIEDHSKIKGISELYNSEKYFGFGNRFNESMNRFLACCLELQKHIKSLDQTFFLEYKIEKEKVGKKKIKFQNSDEWNQALTYLLIDINTMLEWSRLNDYI
ncbi:beclin-1 [Anaeramoeba flamelloides]|uniref:Beclin-1 n=1 Tax=Anaeramoeba flamelloides TaxID=1746091 RepID=A0AAV7YJ69_9EUKA|nr:beclin-1 [Anaeramoeba flamelloides]